MAEITAITPQKRNQERVNIYVDGEFAFGLAAVAAMGLRVGQTLTPAQVADLKRQDDYEKAKDAALRLLTYRPRSVEEVKRRLIKKGYDEVIVKKVTDYLQEVDLLDDADFAEYWVEQRETFRPRSRMALRRELRQKGVSREAIEAAVEEVDEVEAARSAAQKQLWRYENLNEEDFRLKLGRYLQRRGFSYDIIKQIINETWQAISEEAA